MDKHACRTYFAIFFEIDLDLNAELLRKSMECTPEQLGIYNKDEVEKSITELTGQKPLWRRHHFVLGFNDSYNVDVNVMARKTLKTLFGKEELLRELLAKYNLTASLVVVPEIVADSEDPNPYISPERDIIEFLYKSGAEIDIDYYVI